MKRLALPLLVLALAGCSPAATSVPPPAPIAASPSKGAVTVQPDPRPDLLRADPASLTPPELQQGLLRLVEERGSTVPTQLAHLFARPDLQLGTRDAVPWLEADLDGDGSMEYALTLPMQGTGAALFVIDHVAGGYRVEVDPLSEQSPELMRAYLHSAIDLTGAGGRPQWIWYRPEMIATGSQPYQVFVTEWAPGHFTHLPGPMAISNMTLSVQGKELRLTGVSRAGRLLWPRTDTYRYVAGAFRLVDRAFEGERTYGYDRFWDGAVSEEVGQLDRAEAAYQAVLEEGRPTHPGSYLRYNSPPLEPTPAELAAFDEALRSFARFRLTQIYRRTGRPVPPVPAGSSYGALLQAEECQAAAAWADQNPAFLAALNQAITHAPWTPAVLCSHPSLTEEL